MAYIRDTYRFPNSLEHEIKWAGNYGAKGEKRAPREKATPEQIEKQNAWKREVHSRRTMKLNFERGDLWCTILYPQGTRKGIDEVKKDLTKFIRKLRNEYRKRGDELKFMYRIEIGSRGGIHIHMICNHARGEPPIDMIIQNVWSHGRVHFERFGGEEEDYEKLSSYLVKPQNEEQMQKRTPEERRALRAYSSSRNLIRPKAERKEYKRRTVHKMLVEGIEPTKGYVIDKSSIVKGVNQFTGLSYLYYTEIKIGSRGESG